MKLKEIDLFPIDPKCPFCGCIDRNVVLNLQKDPEVNLLSCNGCYAVSASRIPSKELLQKYYQSYYAQNSQEITVDNTHKIADHIFSSTKQYINKKHLQILDFGGGRDVSLDCKELFIYRR